jgi:hypothetical protein
MKKLLLRSVMFSTLLTFLCGAISHRYMPRVEAMAAPAADMDPHMSMTKLLPLHPGDKAPQQRLAERRVGVSSHIFQGG